MKKRIKTIFGIAIVVFTLQSCSMLMFEEVKFNEDGSGVYTYRLEMTAEDLVKGLDGLPSDAYDTFDVDENPKVVEYDTVDVEVDSIYFEEEVDEIWIDEEDYDDDSDFSIEEPVKNRDTIWYGSDFMKMAEKELSPNVYKENKKLLESMAEKFEGYTIHLKEKGKESASFEFKKQFQNINQVTDGILLMMLYGQYEDLKKGKGGDSSIAKLLNSNDKIGSKMEYDGINFTRNFFSLDDSISKEEMAEASEMLMMFSSYIKIETQYHFPKKITKANLENTKFSLDGKTMYVETNLLDFIGNPENGNVKLSF